MMESLKKLDIIEDKILLHPNPILRTVSKPINKVDKRVKDTVEVMFKVLKKYDGAGLAGIQINYPHRVFVMGRNVFINPIITSGRGTVISKEGCLSVPMLTGFVKRRKFVQLNAWDLDGNFINKEYRNIEAVTIQHEIDHLDGILFLDKDMGAGDVR